MRGLVLAKCPDRQRPEGERCDVGVEPPVLVDQSQNDSECFQEFHPAILRRGGMDGRGGACYTVAQPARFGSVATDPIAGDVARALRFAGQQLRASQSGGRP